MKKYKGYLENAQDDLKKYKDMTPKQYQGEIKRRNVARGMKSIFRWAIWIALVVGYYYASRTPTYLLLKRQKQIALMKKSGNVVKGMIIGALGFLIAMPSFSVTKIKWSDGSTSEEVDLAPLAMKLIGIVMIVVLVIYAMMVILPWLVVINYLRNYQIEMVEKYFDMMMAKLRGAKQSIVS
ncbi:hypothetical protein GF324_10015 [bacterium]|nr:hypothetical protein [bacterium]